MERKNKIIKVSILSIIANIVLVAIKSVVGLLAGSIAIVLDALNNFTDAVSSIVTMIGAKIASKAPDREHPYGHGRVEYLSALVVAGLVIYAGITALIESIHKIIEGDFPEYNTIGLVLISLTVAVKIGLGLYVKKRGTKLKSEALKNSGQDALLDAIISASTVIAALIYLASGVNLEAYLAALISLIIIKSGFDMIKESYVKIVGERADPKLTSEIRQTISKVPGVLGVFDLVINNYGPDLDLASVHIEVKDDTPAHEIDKLTREITNRVYKKHNIILTAVGIYAANLNEKSIKIRDDITAAVTKIPNILGIHGFYLDKKAQKIQFDAVVDFREQNRHSLERKIVKTAKSLYPNYSYEITLDIDISD